MSGDPLERLCERLGHRFRDRGLLAEALTHRSAGGRHNERLEFLGDAVLNLVVAEILHARFPELDEGALSRLRARIVQGRTLAAVAAELDLGPHLRLGAGELKSGGFRRPSILADAVEALIGAAYLESGLEGARGVVRRLLGERLDALAPQDAVKDPKTRLQERLQGAGRPLPCYELVRAEGPEHARRFTVRCRLEDGDLAAEGGGGSRREAEQAAAARLLEMLGDG
ncbi:ribonuclease III [Inmirania thermothiophila]|uniref:Ribonuclease 3 n=1 Tax=Inmirania thermothiophila TaxID=1750597 RepID=A0A3N1Y0S6_9GAMM|nr:ribonuclease III [Inmirania thermothiophila]ROR32131.1 RNAse III [Inmirania thermothiophila]